MNVKSFQWEGGNDGICVSIRQSSKTASIVAVCFSRFLLNTTFHLNFSQWSEQKAAGHQWPHPGHGGHAILREPVPYAQAGSTQQHLKVNSKHNQDQNSIAMFYLLERMHTMMASAGSFRSWRKCSDQNRAEALDPPQSLTEASQTGTHWGQDKPISVHLGAAVF